MPVITLVLAFTNEQHYFYWSSIREVPTACGSAARVPRRAVVLGARRLQLLPRSDRDPDTRSRPAPFPSAVSPANRADHDRRDGAVGRQSPVPHARAAGRHRSHAAGICRLRRVLYVGDLSPPPVRPRARRARHGGGQHGRRRARARRAAPHRRSECGRRALHRPHHEQLRPAGGRRGGVVERGRSPKTGRSCRASRRSSRRSRGPGISRSRSPRCATHSVASSAGW